MPRPRRLAALALAVLAASAGLTAAPATAETAGGEIVLPPVYTDTVPRLQYVLGSAEGLSWSQDGGAPSGEPGGGGATLRYSVHGGPQRVRVSGYDGGEGITLIDRQLAFKTGRDYAEGLAEIDITTGVRTTLAANDTNVGARFISGTGDGWLQRSGSAGVVRTITATSEITSYRSPWATATTALWIRALDADSRGAMLVLDDYDATDERDPARLAYLDFASGAWTELALRTPTAPVENIEGALADGTIVWGLNGKLHLVDRADPTLTSTIPVGYGINNLTANGDSVAFVRYARRTSDSPLEMRIFSGPVAGPYAEVASSLPLLRLMVAADQGDFAVGAGNTVADRGLYRLTPGSTKLGEPLVLFGPSAPLGIDASAGRLVTVTPRQTRTAESQTITSDAAVTSLSAGASSVLTAKLPNATPPELSGGHSAYLTGTGAARVAVVQDGTREIARYPVHSTATAVSLSGKRLLVAQNCSDPCEGVEKPNGVLIDLDTGRRTTVPYTRAIFGDTIVYALPTGEIRRRNVVSGAETVLRPPGLPAKRSTEIRVQEILLAASGDWVLWTLPQDGGYTENGSVNPPGETAAVHVGTGQRVDLPANLDAGSAGEIRLANGVAAWIDRGDRTVHLVDLSAGAFSTVGTAWRKFSEPRSWLALTDEFVAWVAPDDLTHLLPLRDAAEGTPRYLGTVDAAGFSAADGLADYKPQIDVSRPLTTWTMTITAAAPSGSVTTATATAGTGTVVRTLKGSARSGAVRPTWDGKTADGTRVPDGTYTWTLTGTGIGGPLRRADGSTGTVRGTVRVDSTTPVPTLNVPTTAGLSGFAVRWSSAERGVRFTVKVARGYRKDGRVVWSATRTWKSSTTATSARYTGTPYTLRKGYRYRITVIATDALGNHRQTSKIVRIPT